MPIVNNISELNERVTFVQMTSKPGPEPGEDIATDLFSCWAKIRTANIRDIKLGNIPGYEDTIDIVIRQQQQLAIDNKMMVRWQNKLYDIVEINPDYAEKAFMVVVVKARK
ncbi:phage head closure protein [Tetragenococcus solitarius]|uniref:Head-tail adaptor protein n=1 Tax=Tetragenococcus solitarius TaxID=71453 RepID=A0ABP6KU76_9ENTE|nr:phage head closure protein [Tetragenococcus solitarius]